MLEQNSPFGGCAAPWGACTLPLGDPIAPKFSIEGNEWFAEHEAPAEQANALQERPEGPYEPDRAD
jgi:hypothetical protein